MNLKFTFSFLLSLLFFTGSAQSWVKAQDFPSHHRDDGVSFVVGNFAYCGTGLSNWFAPLNDFQKFDFNNNTWSAISSLPAGNERQYAVSFSGNNTGFVFGGVNGSGYLSDLWAYNPLADTWTQKTTLPSLGRSGAVSFVINDTAYVIGGKTDSTNATNQVWAYSIIHNSWLQKSNFPFNGRFRASAFEKDGLGYIVFGQDETGVLHNEIYEYDSKNDLWSWFTDFPSTPRYYAFAQVSAGLLAGLGQDSTGAIKNDLWFYDFGNNNWTAQNNLPSRGVRGMMAFSNTSYSYLTTGLDSAFLRSKETWVFSNPIGLKENAQLKMILYPNPTKGIVILKNEAFSKGQCNFKVYSTKGQIVLSGKFLKEKQEIDLSHLPKGVYIIKVMSRNGSRFFKVQVLF